MPKVDHYPKSLRKAIRYLKQEAPLEQLDEFKQTIERVIQIRVLKTKQD